MATRACLLFQPLGPRQTQVGPKTKAQPRELSSPRLGGAGFNLMALRRRERHMPTLVPAQAFLHLGDVVAHANRHGV